MQATRDIWIMAEALENLGDLALLGQMIEALLGHPRVGRIAVRQWSPPGDQPAAWLADAGIEVVDAKRVASLWPGKRLLLYAGGQAVRGNASRASLLALLCTVIASRIAGGRRAAVAIGASELHGPFDRTIWRRVLSSFGLVSCRDEASLTRLQALLGTQKLELTDDLAFLPSSLHERLATSRPASHVLVAPCCDASEDRLLNPPAVARIVEAVASAVPAPDTVILCHDPRPQMDVAIAERIAGELPRRANHKVAIDQEVSLDAAIDRYRACAAVITNRLHALIFGLLAGKPVFVIGDGNAKVEGFARRFRVPVIPQSLSGAALAEAVQAGQCPEVRAFRSAELERAQAAAARNLTLLESLL